MNLRDAIAVFLCVLICAALAVLFSAMAVGESHAAARHTQSTAKAQKPGGEQIQIPAGKENLPAEEVFKNIEILKGKPASRLPGMMTALNGLLGVECTHCHVKDAWEKEEPAAKLTARRMFKMLGNVTHTYFGDENKVTCWTCHHGGTKPPNGREEIGAGMAKLPEERRQIVAALTAKLGEKKDKPAGEVFENIRMFKEMPAERLLGLMSVLTVVLGVDCSHCHVPDAWAKDDKAPKQTARKMFQMLPDINHQLFDSEFKVACWTCHRGSTKPEAMPK